MLLLNDKVIKYFIWSAISIALLLIIFIKQTVISIETSTNEYFLLEDTFTISWIHSVEKEEWNEIYIINDEGTLTLTETYFKTFGAGVPVDGEIIPSNDGYVHMKIMRQMDSLTLVVSENVQTTLYSGDKKVPLYKLAEKDYEEINISVKSIHLWELLQKRRSL